MNDRKELTLEQLLTTPDVAPEEVTIAGGFLLVRGLTPEEHDRFDAENYQSRKDSKDGHVQDYRARLLHFCCVDMAGEPKFTLEETRRLAKKRLPDLERVVDAALRLSGLTQQAQEAQRGNSEAGRSD